MGEYSKGMARRIGLATALINDPDLLILDEPTSGMDPIGTNLIKDLIVDLGKRGKTILLSSHLLADVEDVCDRVMILYGGMQRALGKTHELLSRSELTQITTRRLDEDTIEEIRSLIRAKTGDAGVDVESPAEKLESFFLKIVRQAQADRVQTSGVVQGASGELPAFLRSSTPDRGIVEELVAAGRERPAEPEPGPEPEPVEPQPDRELIGGLVAEAAKPKPLPRQDQAELPPALPEAEVDHSVIDSLLQKRRSQDSDKKPREDRDG